MADQLHQASMASNNQANPSLPLLQTKESISLSQSQHHEDETKLLRNEEIKIPSVTSAQVAEEESGREKLKKHRVEVAGRVWIPDIWGQEEFLKDWADCTTFDDTLFPNGIMSARSALVAEGRRGTSTRLRSIENRC